MAPKHQSSRANGEEPSPVAWLEHEPDKTKGVKQAWDEQCALINAIYDTEEDTEDPEDSESFLPEGKSESKIDVPKLIEKVKMMSKPGDSSESDDLSIAIKHLSEAHNAHTSKDIDPNVIVKVAQLLSIMDECVYMRDYESEREAYEMLKPYAGQLKKAKETRKSLQGERVLGVMTEAAKKMDKITQDIGSVADAMGLEYVPLCNFSSDGKLLRNGPYCGAFYRERKDDDNKGFIVMAFKGTGSFKELITDLKFSMKPAIGASPLRGNCHIGFFDGVYKEFLSALSAHKKIDVALPFQLLRNQLWRLSDQIQKGQTTHKTQVWVTGHSLGAAYATHCWQGLLATSRLNAHVNNRVIRDLFTFGSPRVGNKDYASYPNDIRDFQRSWRFVNDNDSVARFPRRSPSGQHYYHQDTEIKISPTSIRVGISEISVDVESTEAQEEGSLIISPDHALEKYWESLRSGKVKDRAKWPKAQHREEHENEPHTSFDGDLVVWSLGDHHHRGFQESEAHKDHIPDGTKNRQESVFMSDNRHEVDPHELEDGGKYRSVVKIQSLFGSTWTMGTGWLIRKDLVVTAGHNVFSEKYGGQAQKVKCWVGYKGRKFVDDQSVQHRMALNIVTTGAWFHQRKSRRLGDVALIQVSDPFDGELGLFAFGNSPQDVEDELVTVVGYPGDKHAKMNGFKDIGARMYVGNMRTDYNIQEAKSHMIEYMVPTYGGQSGAPILIGRSEAIGTHCYGGGGSQPNSGNSIGGAHGNNYKQFIKRLDHSHHEGPTPIASHTPLFKKSSGKENRDKEGNEETFWDVFQKVAKVGSVALPSAGAFLGPVGALLGTVAGGVLGSLAESAESAVVSIPDEKAQEACIQRAQLAEATLQSVIRLGQSKQSSEVFKKMQQLWDEDRLHQIQQLCHLISPVLMNYGFLVSADHWEKGINPNPEMRQLSDGNVALRQPGGAESGHPNDAFVEALFRDDTRRLDGIPTEGEESLSEWLAPLMKQAIIRAKPLASKAAVLAIDEIIKRFTRTKGGQESLPALDEQDKSFQTIIQRAIMADCALQAVETLSEKQLNELMSAPTDAGGEESIIDSIKTRVQKIGPVALRYAKVAVKKYLPVLLGALREKLDPDSSTKAKEAPRVIETNNLVGSTKARGAPLVHEWKGEVMLSNTETSREMEWIEKLGDGGPYPQDDGNDDQDSNLDAPIVEPRPPESPTNRPNATLPTGDEEKEKEEEEEL